MNKLPVANVVAKNTTSKNSLCPQCNCVLYLRTVIYLQLEGFQTLNE